MNISVIIGAVIALLCLFAAFRFLRKKRLIDDMPTSKTLGVFIGLAELKGTAESDKPLTSYLAGAPCPSGERILGIPDKDRTRIDVLSVIATFSATQ